MFLSLAYVQGKGALELTVLQPVQTLLKRWRRANGDGLSKFLGGYIGGLSKVGRKRWAILKELELGGNEVFGCSEEELVKLHGAEEEEVEEEAVPDDASAVVTKRRTSNPRGERGSQAGRERRKRQRVEGAGEEKAGGSGGGGSSGGGERNRSKTTGGRRPQKGEEGWDSGASEDELELQILKEQEQLRAMKSRRGTKRRGGG
ncbi:hypothetical protein TrVE_jg5773 [Triparma verrucosa]|uniref:Uncharacterized protein n=1 Tax=Triparma verrucosa TaxID=1606542 RepID=A0A9W7DQA9_9STRA|nr:hypothetical protein TrVE_jg5773 [Triparma verrucosa]